MTNQLPYGNNTIVIPFTIKRDDAGQSRSPPLPRERPASGTTEPASGT